jgi:two-component system response regulator AtoC
VGDTRSRRVDVRILAATNRDLETMVAEGRFRQDLYYRLSVFRLELPPLRVRTDDIPLLARYFLREASARFDRPVRGFTDEAHTQLRAYPWPGNVRELLNAVQRAVVLCGAGLVDAVHLHLDEGATASFSSLSASSASPVEEPEDLDLKAALDRSRQEVERRYIELALQRNDGNRTRAAKVLGISYRALMYKLKEYGL